MYTVNVDIFAQYIFSRISRRALDARKFDASENHYHKRTNRIDKYMRENLTMRICHLMLDARKFSCTKISTFTVFNVFSIRYISRMTEKGWGAFLTRRPRCNVLLASFIIVCHADLNSPFLLWHNIIYRLPLKCLSLNQKMLSYR